MTFQTITRIYIGIFIERILANTIFRRRFSIISFAMGSGSKRRTNWEFFSTFYTVYCSWILVKTVRTVTGICLVSIASAAGSWGWWCTGRKSFRAGEAVCWKRVIVVSVVACTLIWYRFSVGSVARYPFCGGSTGWIFFGTFGTSIHRRY